MNESNTISTEIVEEPHPPAPSECCGGGSCCPCVWDLYFEQKRLWQEQQKQLNSDQNDRVNTNS